MQIRPENILIMGGSSGIGLATAQCLYNHGVRTITLASSNQDKLRDATISLQLPTGAKVYCCAFDIRNISSQGKMIEKVQEATGSFVDGLVISVGKFYGCGNWAGFNISEHDWDKIMDINLKGPFYLLRNFANYLLANKRGGNICVVSSMCAKLDTLGIYELTKNALSRTVHAYGKHLATFGIVLNAVEPGVTNTNINFEFHKQFTDGIREGEQFTRAGIGRLIRPEEIGECICFFMSDLGEVMAGSCLLASGGDKYVRY